MSKINDTPVDDDILQATDDEGKVIAPEDIMSRGHKPQKIRFRAAGQNHVCEVVFSQVSYQERVAVGEFARRHSVEAGLTGQEDLDNDQDARVLVERVEREILTHPERLNLRARIAASALARDAAGRVRISTPQFQEVAPKDLAKTLAKDEIFGRKIINAVCNAVDDFFA